MLSGDLDSNGLNLVVELTDKNNKKYKRVLNVKDAIESFITAKQIKLPSK